MPVNLMHIKELKELTQILYFEGDYALCRTKDGKGLYRGVINRRGEIVWNDKWRHIVMRVHEYPNIFRTYNDDKPPQRLFYGVEKQAFVEPRRKKAGLLDKFGNVLVPFEYDFLDPTYTEDIISAKNKAGSFSLTLGMRRLNCFN